MTIDFTQQKLIQHLEESLLNTTRARLENWGRWWFRDNTLEIRKASGAITRSMSGVLLAYAPHPTKSGYYTQPNTPIDDTDALDLHLQIIHLTPAQQRELSRHYAEQHGGKPSTPAQRQTRRRAITALINITLHHAQSDT